jgi:dipeptidyl-peptidase-4
MQSLSAGQNLLNRWQMQYIYKKMIISLSWSDGVKQITTDGGKGIVYGQSVHRNEFGISKGFF